MPVTVGLVCGIWLIVAAVCGEDYLPRGPFNVLYYIRMITCAIAAVCGLTVVVINIFGW